MQKQNSAASAMGPKAGLNPTNNNIATIVQWTLVVAAPMLVYFGTSRIQIPHMQCVFYAITVTALVLWGLSLMSDTMVAVTLPVVYIVLQVASPRAVFSAWASSTGWIVFGALIFAYIMSHTGLAKRLALWPMTLARGSFNGLLWSILIAGFLISPLIPSVMGKAALIATICVGICEALGLEKKSRPASAIIIAGLIGVSAAKQGFLTGGGDIILYTNQIAQVTGHTITWSDFFIQNFPLALIYAPISILTLIVVLRPKVTSNTSEYIAQTKKDIGSMGFAEKKTAALLLALVALLITDRWHGLDAGWIIIILSFIAFLPKIGLMTEKHLQKMSLASVFFVVGCMSIGSAATATGADKALAQSLAPILEGSSELSSVILAYLAGTAINFLLTPLAALSAMTVPLTELSMQLGLNPIPIMYAFSYGLEQYIFPYEYAVLLFFYATGWVHLKHIIAVFSVRFVVALIFLVVVAVPYWKFLGLFGPLAN